MSRNTHDRSLDHHGLDTDQNVTVSGGAIGSIADGDTLHSALSKLYTSHAGLLTAKGDLLVYTGAQLARLPVGADGKVLTADSAQSTGLSYTTVSGGGAALTVKEIDGTPTVTNVTTIKFANGTVTDNGSGTVTISGGSGSLGGTAGAAHTGTTGAAGTAVTAAESDHKHPAQILLTGAAVNDKVFSIRYSALAYDQLIGQLNSGGLAQLRFMASSTDGIAFQGQASTATGTDKYKVDVVGIGSSSPIVNLQATGTITRGGSETSLWDSDIGVSVASEGHTHGTTVVMNADDTSTSTTAADITQLQVLLVSGIEYRFDAILKFKTAATTTGIYLGISSPTVTYANWNAWVPTSATAVEFESFNASGFGHTTGGVASANTYYTAELRGIIKPSASGNFNISFATEVAGSTVTVGAGSRLTVTT